MLAWLGRFKDSDEGQDLIEYSLLICLIALATMAFLGVGRDPVERIWVHTDGSITSANRAATGGAS